MNDVDVWLARASRVTQRAAEDSHRALANRLAGERSPASHRARREARRTVACVAMVTLVSFVVSGWIARSMWGDEPLSPAWVAAPSSSSPYVLLVGQ
ncbi:MAG TPA: CnrY/NccY family anti-sigma factor [Dyella sp.]|uniref:CnrY/NccY family anti-sigma factor n=1 Tax=Dyella sp. TaxID=1869338 RepID=UPI002F939863